MKLQTVFFLVFLILGSIALVNTTEKNQNQNLPQKKQI